jgi:hypothetical protein
MRCLDASDDPTRPSLEIKEPRHTVAGPDFVRARRRDSGSLGQSGRTDLVTAAERDNASFRLGRGLGRATSRSAGAVEKAGVTGLLVAAPPLMRGLARDPKGLGGTGHGPTVLDQTTQAKSTLRGQWSVTVHFEPSWLLWVCQQLHIALRAHLICGFSASTRSMGRTPGRHSSIGIQLRLRPLPMSNRADDK